MYYFWIFMIYGVIGFLLETVFRLLVTRRLENRKLMLFLPICPVYGLGAAALIALLDPVRDNLILMFIGGAAIAGTVEFLYSYLCEALFGVLVWDYSELRGSFNGRVNVFFIAAWGFLTVALFRVIRPVVDTLIARIPADMFLPMLSVALIDSAMTCIVFYRYGREGGKPTGCGALTLR